MAKSSDRHAAKFPTSPAVPERVAAIDALRGFDMFWIIGGRELFLAIVAFFQSPLPEWAERHFEHVAWEGFVAWDLIMPLFLFVVGAAMPFSFSRRLESGHAKGAIYANIIRRAVVLFILGMIVQGHLLDFNLPTFHPFANTLQAIAVGYLFAGILLLIAPIWGQIAAAALLMIGYWLLLMYVPLPGHGVGVLEPNANMALVVDKWVLGEFIDGTQPPYTWVLSGMTFTATVLLGVFSGHVLRSSVSHIAKIICLMLLGVACLAGGWAWAEWLGFPIVKHIWTSSMVLWAAGWSYLLLALFYLLFDVAGLHRLAFPWIVIGMNAITIYVASFFIPFQRIAESLVGGLAAQLGPLGPLVISFTSVLLVWLLLYHLYIQKIFVRI